MASFRAKMGRERLRKRKKKLSFRSIQPQPEIGNSKKIAKEIQKMKKKSLWLLFKPKRDGKG